MVDKGSGSGGSFGFGRSFFFRASSFGVFASTLVSVSTLVSASTLVSVLVSALLRLDAGCQPQPRLLLQVPSQLQLRPWFLLASMRYLLQPLLRLLLQVRLRPQLQLRPWFLLPPQCWLFQLQPLPRLLFQVRFGQTSASASVLVLALGVLAFGVFTS